MIKKIDLYVLSSGHVIPRYLKNVPEIQVHIVRSQEELFYVLTKMEVNVLVDVEILTETILINFQKIQKTFSRSNFIITHQDIENTAILILKKNPVLVLNKSENDLIRNVLEFVRGGVVITRKHRRYDAQTKVMIKKDLSGADTRVGISLQDGLMVDYSKEGAKIRTRGLNLAVKEFINIIYLNRNGRWVSVDSQIRWRQYEVDGSLVFGLQFISS